MTKQRNVSLFRVAHHAGVARSTASAALNGKPGVSDETRAKVLAAAEELGFRPNAVARSLRRGHTPAVGIIIDPRTYELESRFARAFHSRYFLALMEELSAHGIPVFQATLERIESLQNLPIDAVQVFAVNEDIDLPEGFCVGTPLVHSLKRLRHHGPTSFAIHNLSAMMTDALDHLAGQGAVRPGLIGREEETTYNATLTDAYRQWCDERGINPIVSVSQGEPQQMEDRSAAMVADGQADAVVSLVAEGASVMAGVARAGKTVPDDVLVLSMSEGAVEEFTHPPGSVMSLCGDQSGRMVAKVFARGIASGEWPATIDLPYELIIRESSTRKV